MHQPIPEQGKWLRQVVTGYFAYHAVPTNGHALMALRFHITNLWRRTLTKRSQKDETTSNDDHIAHILKLKDGSAWKAWGAENADIFRVAAWNSWRDENRNIRPNLWSAGLSGVNLNFADLHEANLKDAHLDGALLHQANLKAANLSKAYLYQADLFWADLSKADLTRANLLGASLVGANLSGANLSGADLSEAVFVNTDLTGADLTGCRIYGVSAWGLKLDSTTKQQNLVITDKNQPAITVDNIEVAQFIYLLLHNEKIRDVIDTIGKKGVLLLGRFTEGRMEVLERLRDKLRDLGFVPMVFNFDKPETKDFTETVRLLANLSHFVIVDITNPRSAPLELQATVPDYMIPFAPILQEGEKPFAMFEDLQNKYDWVLQPVFSYPSVERLIEGLEDKIVRRAQAKFNELLARRTNQLRIEKM